MFKTKLEVDRHVDNCLKKINIETERNLRCLSFAKLYFKVGDYEHACRYISSYLSVKPKSAEGQLWLGKCLEKQGKKEAALEAYRNSLQIDQKQKNLVLKVCELLSSDDVSLDKSGARYFCNLAQNVDPNNPIIYTLKERLITTENEDPEEITKLLLKELETRPTDVNLRVRLLKHFLQHNMIKEAYKHASAIEEKSLSIFHKDLNWYETLAEVLVRFERDRSLASQLTWEFWFLSVSVLDRLVALSLDEHVDHIKNNAECITAAFNFDQMLSKASRNISQCPDCQLVSVFLNHYHAQLYFHIATLIFKQAKKSLIHFKEASNITLPVLLAAYHASPPDLHSMWFVHSSENTRRLVINWHKEASFRCSQTGHVLLEAAKYRKSVVIEKATQYSTGIWRDQLFKKVFVQRDQQQKMATSYFVSSPTPLEPVIKLPDPADVLKHDEIAQIMHPDSLHHYIWIVMNNKLSDFEVKTFDGLQYSIRNLSNCAAESLNVLDVQAFLYCASMCAKSKIEDNKHNSYYNQDKPRVLPASITETLGTLNQSKFLTAAFKLYNNLSSSDMSELRLMLIKGIEVIRCIGHHGLHVKLLVELANIFDERAKMVTKQSEIEFNHARAELYWKTALPLLEKIKNNQLITYPNNRLFEYNSRKITVLDAAANIEKGKLFTATLLMKKKEYDRALQIFEELKDPYASFYQSQIYKHMADQKTSQNKENVTSEMRSQNIILLSKARDCLYLTLDRLRDPSVERKHPLNDQLASEIEKMERLLSRIDPDCNNRNECDGMSNENGSSDNSVGEQYLSTYAHTSFQNGTHYTSKQETHNHSTPLRFSRQEARPSPERLDAQIRQMAATRDLALNSVLEQNKLLVESHKNLVEDLRGFKEAIHNLTSVIEELRTMKIGFEELEGKLGHSNDDLQNVMDVVKEMRKELNELRKDQNKNNQLSDEDLFVLDPDYGVDYNNSNSIMNPIFPNVYPNYPPGRMPNANALTAYGPPGIYPGLYPGLAYAYGGLGLPQPGALPFNSDPQVPGLTTPVSASYPQTLMCQPVLNSALSSASIGVGMLTGQALSQVTSQPTVKDTAKSSLTNVTSTTPSISMPFSSIVSKSPPVNVVITNSDPLPTNRSMISQPVLSVTIPPQHIKGSTPKSQPHNYQIPMPSSGITTIASTPSILSKPPPAISTQSLLSNVAPPLFSAVTQSKSAAKNVSLGLQIEKSLDETFKTNTSNVSNISTSSVEEHDPCPDFKPIVPLPDEVPLNTGEESEEELFCERAKLFRFVSSNGNTEWKERGIGVLKILNNRETGKVRILMRRDQVHKICANHFIDKTMTLIPMKNNDRTFIWVAHDFADEVTVVEKLCVKFKTAIEANKFFDAFEAAKKLLDKVPEKGSKNEPIKIVNTTKESQKLEISKGTPSNSQSTTLGGFVFTSTPNFKPKENTAPKIAESKELPKSSPFTNFNFGKSSSVSSIVFKPTVPTPEAQTFSPLVISQQKSDSTQNNDSLAEDFVPTAEFKPVVALPDLVEVKTGEENSEVLFESRAKLFRYDQSGQTKEWKERGVGIIKILKDDTIRLVMRRDQVHKVCCNHQVLKNMIFKFNSTNPKAVVWSCQDFSEGVLTAEMFTVRFKTEEQARDFLETIQTAQTSLDENNKITSKHHKPESRPRATSFGDKFKPAKGSWECKTCYVVNEAKASTCIACDTSKTGTSGKKSEESGTLFSFGSSIKTDPSTPNTGFRFGQGTSTSLLVNQSHPLKFSSPEVKKEDIKSEKKSGFGDAFKPKAGTWECNACLIRNDSGNLYCISCENPKDDTVSKKESNKGINLDTPGMKFTFGIPSPSAATPNVGLSQIFTPNIENKSVSIFKTSTVNQSSFKSDTPTTGSKFLFGSPQKHDFEFKPRSPRRVSAGQGDEGAESDASYVEEEEDNIYFKPVIPLPDKVDVITGEESEEVLYCHRAKLFRFVDGEWKERGLGDVKILKNKISGKLRVLMRREQVLKICLNHVLSKDVEYLPKDEKSWLFHVHDYSEGEFAHQQFCLRFKNDEIAQDFKNAVSKALSMSTGSGDQGSTKSSKDEDSDDVILVSETTVSTEDEKEALRLKLPPKFLSYKQLPDCTCDQCKKDDEYLKELFIDNKKYVPISTGTPKSNVATIFGNSIASNASSTGSTVFGTPMGSIINSTPSPDDKSENLKKSSLNPPSLTRLLTTDVKKTDVATTKSFTFSFGQPAAATTNIFSPATTSQSIFGCNGSGSTIFGTATPPSTGFFGKPAATTSNIFAANTSVFSTKPSNNSSNVSSVSTTMSLFSTPIFEAPKATNPIFCGTSTAISNSTTQSIFNTPTFETRTTTGSIFGGTVTAVSTSSSSIVQPLLGTLKSETQKTTNSIFGGTTAVSTASSSTTLFGTPTFNKTTNIFGGSTTLDTASNSIFSSSTKSNLFSTPTLSGASNLQATTEKQALQSTNMFGWKTTEIEGSRTGNLKEDDEIVLKASSTVSFADLAAGTSPDIKPAFSKTGDGNFAFLGAGAPVFGSISKHVSKASDKDKSKNESDDENTNTQEEEYDPHFEPIVPLPEAIVVTTGEEDEIALFNERAKLYRYDTNTKEWKERGVGQIKVLQHKELDTYRLLLRREQVHKIVLNQLIIPTLELQPMVSSDKAWMWAGYNYTDEENNLENLAVRFKNVELAAKFHDVVCYVVKKITEVQNNSSLPTSVQNYGVEDVSDDDNNHDGCNEECAEEEVEGDEEEYEEDDRSVMFMKRCTLSELQPDNTWKQVCMGDLQVYYDTEVYVARIAVNDDSGNCASNTLIGVNTVMDINKNECTWKAVEWIDTQPNWRNLKATFSSEIAAQEFHSNYLEGVNYAEQVHIFDEIPQVNDVETED